LSKNFERWKELAALCLIEQDPQKLTELASEMNQALNPALKGTSARPDGAELSPGIAGGISRIGAD
jgi:hypothetical protein